MKIFITMIILSSCLLLSQCANIDLTGHVTQQGNLIDKKKVAKLKLGMDKQQVANILGSSLLAPSFRSNRWDYAYTRTKGNRLQTQKHLVLHFNNRRLSAISPS